MSRVWFGVWLCAHLRRLAPAACRLPFCFRAFLLFPTAAGTCPKSGAKLIYFYKEKNIDGGNTLIFSRLWRAVSSHLLASHFPFISFHPFPIFPIKASLASYFPKLYPHCFYKFYGWIKNFLEKLILELLCIGIFSFFACCKYLICGLLV